MAAELHKTVPLCEGGEIVLKKMSWGFWKKFKSELADMLGAETTTKAVSLFLPFFVAGARGEVGEDDLRQMDLDEDKLLSIPGAAKAFTETIDRLTDELVKDCCLGDLPEDNMVAEDWLRARGAALEISDIHGLVRLEKNSLAGLFGGLLSLIGGQEKDSPTGGSNGKGSSQEAMAGAPA